VGDETEQVSFDGSALEVQTVIKHILVGLDGSPTAEVVLPYVESVAKATGALVSLVRAISSGAETPSLQDDNPELVPITVAVPLERPHAREDAVRNEHYQAEKYLDTVVKRLGAAGIVADTTITPGDPAELVLSEARTRKVDLIMLATHGRSGLGRLIYGSVADKILTHSTVPVFLARSSTVGLGSRFGQSNAPILVALDGTPESERSLPLALELARAFSTSLALVEVVPIQAAVMTPDGGWMTDLPMDIQVREEEIANDYLAALNAKIRAGGTDVKVTVRRDAIGVGIGAAAAESGAALIVMATHASTGLVRALVGSVALDVLHRVNLPLLLINPHVPAPDQASLAAAEGSTASSV
jgi:nucleotide-binding universal stress UspA family protein